MGRRGLTIDHLQPHDLMQLSDVGSLPFGDAPPWVCAELSTTPWVVKRRSPSKPGCVAVGVRGGRRALRHAMHIDPRHIRDVVRPEDLIGAEPIRDMPAFRALSRLRSRIGSWNLRWGPTGSTGFELATGATTVTDGSDLDLIVRLDSVSSENLEQLKALNAQCTSAQVRIDCQVQLPAGAVALSELTGTNPQVLLRSNTGVCLTPRHLLS